MRRTKQVKAYMKNKGIVEKCFIGFMLLFVLYESTMIIYLNLTQLSYHMGYDASVSYLMVNEIYKQKTIFLQNWVYTTTFCWDFPVPLAALFMFIFKDVFVAHGIANVVLVFLLVFLFVKVMDKLKMSLAAKLLVIIFLLCPYVDSEFANLNDLGYASCILTSASYYSLQMIISFALIYCFISMESGKKLTLCMKGICVLTGGGKSCFCGFSRISCRDYGYCSAYCLWDHCIFC